MSVENDNNSRANHIAGEKHYFDKNYDEAIAFLTKAIDGDPRSYRAYDRRGSAYKSLGQYDLALADYNRALEINPTFDNALRNRGHVFRHINMWQSALEDFEASKRYCDSERGREVLDMFIEGVRKKLDEAE